MRNITLIEGVKGAGKSRWINQKYSGCKPDYNILEVINKSDFNTVIYVLENKSDKNIVVLNSGSDTKDIILGFEKVVSKYPTADIFTAIRPKATDRNRHKWMKDALHIKSTDNVTVITLP